MSTSYKWFAKILVVTAMLIFFMPMFFLLNLITSENMWVFIAVIFGCSIIYDATKRILSSEISTINEWFDIIKLSWLGLLCIIISFAGIYIDIFAFKYYGISLIWFPAFTLGMFLLSKAETTFKSSDQVKHNSMKIAPKALKGHEGYATDRINRYDAFENFKKISNNLFHQYADSSQSSKHLNDLYSFYVTPGGRFGGLNKKIVDVFYGSRPFDSITEIGADFQPTVTTETAYGAALSYQRTDDGQVLCSLHPAGSENFHASEDFILLEIVKNPDELSCKSKQHWRMFQAYMETTCLDGRPSLLQKILVFYLRNFKEYVVKQTLQKRKATVFFGEIAKYTLTVGLSGFIILFVTWSKDSVDNNQVTERHREVLNIYSDIADSARSIADSSETIEAKIYTLDQTASENLKLLNLAILERASRIEKAVTDLKEVTETTINNSRNASEQ